MKKMTIIAFGAVFAFSYGHAYAAEIVCAQMATAYESLCDGGLNTQMTGVTFDLDGSASMPGCASMSTQCWETYTDTYSPWYTCTRCEDGYTLTRTTATMMGCGTAEYKYCEQSCSGCSDCESDTTWSSAGTGYEQKVTRTCNCNTCAVTATSYRCAAGYYGSSTNGTSGCTRCPSSGGVYGTSDAGSTSVASCYIPAGDIAWTDDTGTYVCDEDSYYEE